MIVIVSKDKDFSHALAEQAVRELGIACECAEHMEETKHMHDVALIVSDSLSKAGNVPMLTVKAPLRLRSVLTDMASMLKPQEPGNEIAFAGFIFSARQKTLTYTPSGQSVNLTDKEAQLLKCLLESENITKEALLKTVWGFESDLNTHTLETHIYRLRAKFKDLSGHEMITAMNGQYQLENNDER